MDKSVGLRAFPCSHGVGMPGGKPNGLRHAAGDPTTLCDPRHCSVGCMFDVDGRIDLAFARQNTVNPVPYSGENQPERLEASVPWRLWSYPGTAML